MKHTVHSSIIETACSSTITCSENGLVAKEGFRICPPIATQDPDINAAHLISETVEVSDKQDSSRTASRSDGKFGGVPAKRKYEDMTSCRINAETPENDHELSSKLGFFRENKKKRPPEAADANLMQVEEIKVVQTVPSESRKTGGSAASRSDSASRVVGAVSPEICGGSDLTAENHMAEESSRSSNNGASSIFESAAESVANVSSRDNFGSSVSSLGVLQCFLDQSDGDLREVRVVATSQGQNHPVNILASNKNEVRGITTSTEIRNDPSGRLAAKLEPWDSQQHIVSTTGVAKSVDPIEPIAGTTHASEVWGRSSSCEWLQLGLGSSREAADSVSKQPSNDPRVELSDTSFGQDASNEERVFAKRKITTSMEFPVAVFHCLETDRNNTFHESSNAGSPLQQWHAQARRSSVTASKSEIVPDPSSNMMNPATTFGDSHDSGLIGVRDQMGTMVATVPSYSQDAVKLQDSLCLFGSSIRPQLVLAPSAGRSSSNYPSDGRERPTSSLVTGLIIDEVGYESRSKDQEDIQGNIFPGNRSEPACANAAGIGGSQLQYNRGASSVHMTAAEEARVRSALLPGGMADPGFQFHIDNRPTSLSALMQTSCDQRQAGYSWLQPPPDTTAKRLIPLANNFQGWSSDQSTSKSLTSAYPGGTIDRHSSTPTDQQMQRASDEWGSLFRRVSPKMLFQSQRPVDQGGSSGVQLRSSTGVVDNSSHASASNEAQDSLVTLKRAIEKIQKRPGQWNTSLEQSNLGSVASWCLNGKPILGVRSDQPKLESVANTTGERPVLVAPQLSSDRARGHSRLGRDPVLNANVSHRQSWQPAAADQSKLQQGNVNALKRPSTPSTVGKPKFQLLPPGSRETNHAGFWFILQSAENQNGEGSLPQISKAYLRIKDGKMPVSAVKKYLVTKLGLSSESEVEITCKGQPVVPSLPLQHVRDVIWFSSLNVGKNKDQPSDSAVSQRIDEASAVEADQNQIVRPRGHGTSGAAAMFSKDIVMVLTYRRHPRTLLSALLTT